MSTVNVNAGVAYSATEVLLGKLSGANLNSTLDQAISLLSGNKRITRIVATGPSGTTATAAGGIYTAASKGGTAIVAASQTYSALTGTLKLNLTLAGDYITGSTIYFSLTTAEGSASLCNIHVFGEVLP